MTDKSKKILAGVLVAVLITGSLLISAFSFDSESEAASKSSNINLYSSDEELAAMVKKATSIKTYSDYKDGEYQAVTLNGNSIEFKGTGAQVSGTDLLITEPGTYVISGTLEDGSIIVDSSAEDNVRLVLENANITCKDGAAVYVKECGKNVILSLPEGTDNSITDGSVYQNEYVTTSQSETSAATTGAVSTSEEETDTKTEPSAAIFSKSDLIINGTGALTVNANYNDGITGKDDIEIIGVTLVINAADDGIVGKDSVAIGGGNITIQAAGDGIKSTNSKDAAKGYIVIADGAFKLSTGNDGIQAESTLLIVDGTYDITTGEGAAAAASKNDMGGGMPLGGNDSGGNMTPSVMNGQATSPGTNSQATSPDANSQGSSGRPARPEGSGGMGQQPQMQQPKTTSGDAISSNTTAEETESMKALKAGSRIVIQDGDFTIDSQDDAVHSNGTFAMATPNIEIASGDDGLHADTSIDIYGGKVNITQSYEGIESAKITINDGKITVVASDDGINVAGGNDSSSMGGPQGTDSFTQTSESEQTLTINGGTIDVNASGDGLDMNGSGYMTGGIVTVSGPTNNGNAALDYDGVFEVTGGTLLAVGASGMAQTPSSGTTINTVATMVDVQAAGTEVKLVNSEGETVLSFTPEKEFSHIVISSSLIQSGESYKIVAGDTELASFTSDSVVTNLSASEAGMGGGMMRQDRMNGQRSTSTQNQTTTNDAVTTQNSTTRK
ncbi:carbohydrate-binding domain-containing protein [Clostridium aminobutyricum]|uniref:Carbohydrate-binding domain-containing protein n=1 Tax=Clostridium aminobutyricum TaxID=33953 RepID=A0A939DA34_CLOAM|nr:carbohydrate-binding domain-containing protein [Clostridium aminobutyricum]MBN7773900.1 carbohydrate-binding domain-containing protein [Clostridium aminobutyricum]